ncbi:MAG: PQQ-dependent sugar dehydrogenase, partial [Chloroflexi bacterium]|nr:PQQ-dependent sugar dehydrogenase [Chloroflexota bacterium]
GRWLVTEKGGYGGPIEAAIHLFDASGEQQPEPFATLQVDSTFERGLLGITVDPQFEDNHYVYVYYSQPGEPVVNTTLRYTERDGKGTEPTVIFEAPVLTGAGNHNGGNLHFGPDDKLYISIGENARPAFAQDTQSAYGKLLRLNRDGSVPDDNPFAPAPGWAYGLRNPFDFTFDPQSGNLWATDNGPSCDDELHLIRREQNYGWGPDYQCGSVAEGAIAPVLRWSDTEAVTGVLVYTGDAIPAWQNSLLICAYGTRALYRAPLTADRTGVTEVRQVELPEGFGCGTDIEQAPDGTLYLNDPPNIHRIK